MSVEVTGQVPPEVVDLIARHGDAVASGDQQAVLADFRPDRVGQLLGSARLPERLVGATLLRVVAEENGTVTAFIEYTSAERRAYVLRSRWVELAEGWRVNHVRNVPETPPEPVATGPADDGSDAQHWAGLRAGTLLLPRCTRCAEWIWSPRPICPSCHNPELRWTEVEPTGTVYSWTRTWQPFAPQLSGHVPFTVVVVELSQAGGRRLVGVLKDSEDVEPRPGQVVEGEFEQPTDDTGWPLLRWRLG